MEDRISDIDNTIEEIGAWVKENVKAKKFLTQNIEENVDTTKRSNLRIIGIEKIWRNQAPRPWKYCQQNYNRKLSQPKERDTYKHTRSL